MPGRPMPFRPPAVISAELFSLYGVLSLLKRTSRWMRKIASFGVMRYCLSSFPIRSMSSCTKASKGFFTEVS